jgi:hypothetical protein
MSPGPHGLSCHGMPVDLMLDQALSICTFNNSTSHQPLFTIPSTTNSPSTSPPTASNSCIPSITSRCLSQSRSRSRSTLLVACYGPRGNTITAPSSSLLHESVLDRLVARLRELPIACMNHEYMSRGTVLVAALRKRYFHPLQS